MSANLLVFCGKLSLISACLDYYLIWKVAAARLRQMEKVALCFSWRQGERKSYVPFFFLSTVHVLRARHGQSINRAL